MSEETKEIERREERQTSSLAELVAEPGHETLAESFTRATIVKIVVIAALFMALNWWQFPRLVAMWRHNPNWSHGFVIPLFSLYLLFARRDELFAAKRRVCIWGLPLVILSIVSIMLCYYPIQNDWLRQLSMVALLFSLVLYLGGMKLIRITWVPVFYLAFALPVSPMLYERVAFRLQNLAAAWSTTILRVLGVSISVTASHLTVAGMSGKEYGLTVAEACSGVRSLVAYLALGVAWAYLENRPIWQRVVLVLAAAPIAILCNILRVTITCSAYVIDHPELGQKFMHTFAGLVMLGPALVMFWALGKLLQKIFVEVEDQDDAPETEAQSKPTEGEGA